MAYEPRLVPEPMGMQCGTLGAGFRESEVYTDRRLTGTAVPDAPKWASVPLGVGAWTNAMSFLPLALAPEIDKHPAYRAFAGASFVTTSIGFVGMALVGARRRRAAR